MQFITESFRDQIEAKIVEYERKCGIEFVPVIVRSSGHYEAFRLCLALVGFAAALVFARFSIEEPAFFKEIAAAVLVALAVFLASGWEFLLTRLLPAHLKRAEVEEAAAFHFLKEEDFATRRRIGILIYVSLLERAVYIMADKGVLTKMPGPELAKLGSRLAADFHRSSPGVTFIEALNEIVKKAAAEFPPEADHAPELSPRLREE